MTETIESLYFTVDGVAAPQGSKSIWRGRLVEANPRTKLWRAAVIDAAERALAGRDGFGDDPVTVLLDFYMPRPKTSTRARPSVKPDIDKLARNMLDGLDQAGIYRDDSRVVALHANKYYADDTPSVDVRIERATP